MPRDNTISHPDLPELSNEDVAILYEIINVAYQAPNVHNLPFRAIFAAYDQVLGKHGISPAHDQVYLRFLFRLGERLGGDNDGEKRELFTEFERLLLELGIQLEVESATGSIFAEEETSFSEEDAEFEESRKAYTTEHTPTAAGRDRRASFSVVLDLASEASRARQEFPESPASISRLQDVSDGFGSRPFRAKSPRPDYDSFLQSPVPISRGNRLEDAVEQFKKQRRSVSHDRYDSSHELVQARTLDNRAAGHSRRQKQVQKFDIYEDHLEDVLPQKSSSRIQNELYSKQQEILQSRMQQDAEAVSHIRLWKLAGHSIQQWHMIVLQRQHRRLQMLHVAIQYDRRELLKQSWNEFVQRYSENKQAAEARRRAENTRRQLEEQEQYLKRREESAVKARDVYLVAKAFSHWANCTIERVEENAVARQHLVRLRYFSAWKEITAVNELKVQRMVLKRFLSAWQRRTRQVVAIQSQAAVTLERNLIRSVYSRWFVHFSEQRALAWRTGMLAQKYFLKWVIAVRIRAEQRNVVIKMREQNVQKSQLRRLVDRALYQQSLTAKAESFRARCLVSNTVSYWKRLTQLVPLARQVSMNNSRRAVSAAFVVLKQHQSVAQQAREANSRRLLRNVWTIWNDALRVETMQHQMSDRLLMEVLYKWVLVERGALMKRVHEERVKRQAILGLLARKAVMQQHTLQAEKQISSLRNSRLKRMALQLWIKKQDQARIHINQAEALYQPRIKTQIMHRWHAAHEHQSQNSRWSVEAAFYLRGQRTIKKWVAAAKQSQKQKRREAYSVVKRTYHKDLASRAFEQWKYRSGLVSELAMREQQYQDQQTRNMCLAIWKRWVDRTANHSSMLAQASYYHSNKVLSQPFQDWRAGTQMAQRNTTVATSFFASYVQKNAYDSLRRLQLKIFELQSHEAKASSVYTWTSKRRARGLLRAWAERASSRRSSQPIDRIEHDPTFSDSGPLLPNGTPLLSLAKTPRTRRIQPFLAEPAPQTPFHNLFNPPSHLATPSERSTRARSSSQAQTAFLRLPAQHDALESLTSAPSPPSDASSHQTATTSPTQASMAHTIQALSRPQSKDQPAPTMPTALAIPTIPGIPTTSTAMDSPFPSSQRGWHTSTHVPATDIQPQRRRFVRQAELPARDRNFLVPQDTTAGVGVGAGLRRSLFPNARTAG